MDNLNTPNMTPAPSAPQPVNNPPSSYGTDANYLASNDGNPHHISKTLLTLALVILVILAAGLWFLERQKSKNVAPIQYQKTEEVKVDNALSTTEKVPAGFPSDIPVDKTALVESYAANYEGHATTQYTVRYTTTDSFDKMWDQYNAYMTKAGYTVNAEKQYGSLSGFKGNEHLIVNIAKQAKTTDVSITYVVRQ